MTGDAPRPAEAEERDRGVRFWDRIADRYSRQRIADEAGYQRKLAVTREYFRPDMSVLELGCGTGSTAIAHAPHVREVRAVDVSARMLEIAAGRASDAGVGNVIFERSSVEGLEVADGSVDAVLAMSLLHLLEDRTAAIRRVHAMLADGGVFVSSTACLGDAFKYAALLALIGPPGRWLGLLPHVAVFTAARLEAELADAGFHIEHRWRPAPDKALFLVARKPG